MIESFEEGDLGRRLPTNPSEDLRAAIEERGLRPDLTEDDVAAFDQAMVNARYERLGGHLMFHSHQLPAGYGNLSLVAIERGLEPGAGWSEIAQSYRMSVEDKTEPGSAK